MGLRGKFMPIENKIETNTCCNVSLLIELKRELENGNDLIDYLRENKQLKNNDDEILRIIKWFNEHNYLVPEKPKRIKKE